MNSVLRQLTKSVGSVYKYKFTAPLAIISFTKLLPVFSINSFAISSPTINKLEVNAIRGYSTPPDKNSDICDAMASNNELIKLDFEVYGRVQGVFFRKYTQDEGERLGLRGFCRNTSKGTVTGTLEGSRANIEKMKTWLKTTGSPMSKIDKVEFRNEKPIDAFSFKGKFGIERTV